MNTSEIKISHPEIINTHNIIANKINMSTRNFDIFFEILSSTVWKSPAGMALAWVEMVAPKEWADLADNKNEDIPLRQKKEFIKKFLLDSIKKYVFLLGKNPTLLQKISTRVLVREALAGMLEAHDQDRLIANELSTPYATWKQILAVLTHEPKIWETLECGKQLDVRIDDKGETLCEIVTPGNFILAEEIPDITIRKTEAEGIFPLGNHAIHLKQDVTHITLTSAILRRYRDVIIPPEKEGNVRRRVLKKYAGLPAWKKRYFGNNSQKNPLPEGEPAWSIKESGVF